MMNKAKKIGAALGLSGLALAIPSAAFAVNPIVPTEISGITNFVDIIQTAIRFILIVAFVLAFIFLLIGGIRWITAGGDEKAVSSARGMITAALIGLVIVLVAYALIRVVEIFFGVNILTNTNFAIPTVPR